MFAKHGLEKSPNATSLSTYCEENGLSKSECLKLLNDDMKTITNKMSEKIKNNSIKTAPMDDK